MEYILLAVVLITLFKVASNTLRDRDYLKNFQDTPHAVLQSIIENGNWRLDPDDRSYHPNHHNSHYVPYGKGCCLTSD